MATVVFMLLFVLGFVISLSTFKPTYLGYKLNDLILTRFIGIVLMVSSGLMIYLLSLGTFVR